MRNRFPTTNEYSRRVLIERERIEGEEEGRDWGILAPGVRRTVRLFGCWDGTNVRHSPSAKRHERIKMRPDERTNERMIDFTTSLSLLPTYPISIYLSTYVFDDDHVHRSTAKRDSYPRISEKRQPRGRNENFEATLLSRNFHLFSCISISQDIYFILDTYTCLI